MIELSLGGDASAYRILGDFEFRIRRNIVQAATRAGINEIRTIARRLAPKDTGLLAKQLTTGIKTDRVSGVVTGSLKPKRTKAARRKGARHTGRYLHLVVGGTKPHVIESPDDPMQIRGLGTFSRINHPGAKPRPFMDQAVNLGHRAALAAFDAKFDERVLIEAAKLRATQGET